MVVLARGQLTLNLGFLQIAGDVTVEDRQCAWELYTEITTRLALVGKAADPECDDFSGEVLVESLDSVHKFFGEARAIMRRFPVGKLKTAESQKAHLGALINDLMNHVLRPFLEKWQSPFRYWWQYESDPKLPPFPRQDHYPLRSDFLQDWKDLRFIMRGLREELIKKYDLVDVDKIAEERNATKKGAENKKE